MTLPTAFLDRPIAHRALHDKGDGRPENSLAAVRAAVAAGYGIEIDLQLSSDGVAMVFHDYGLTRLTGETGPIQQRTAAELAAIPLLGGTEGVPTLAQVLQDVAGKVPLLIELKDQDGALGPNVGTLERAAAADLAGYDGPVALMSFNPHSVIALADLCPDLPRGLTTEQFTKADWPTVPAATRDRLSGIPDYAQTGACFVSHHWRDLNDPRVADLQAAGAAVLCWTIRSPEEEAEARKVAANITFEGYLP
ncbi:glycerophosphodiester phosphodiesterase family protein [Mesobacterium sp. TK19101]|uniref:Glycerophosphodiester phosphodiesterase family protein n=1 Tax=Mesobacterium hydrothermale TaxID=3111907 RepID=A0ABU6HBG7_9RHOB|nr:glycerophosphodiester phosphodiesterase family protein [Mesobacterium sp. TK19101]MEC3859807.1 glycerophosphodiester phosphodiesterase family protein [Mesobacterium sp. TK19101]